MTKIATSKFWLIVFFFLAIQKVQTTAINYFFFLSVCTGKFIYFSNPIIRKDIHSRNDILLSSTIEREFEDSERIYKSLQLKTKFIFSYMTLCDSLCCLYLFWPSTAITFHRLGPLFRVRHLMIRLYWTPYEPVRQVILFFCNVTTVLFLYRDSFKFFFYSCWLKKRLLFLTLVLNSTHLNATPSLLMYAWYLAWVVEDRNKLVFAIVFPRDRVSTHG